MKFKKELTEQEIVIAIETVFLYMKGTYFKKHRNETICIKTLEQFENVFGLPYTSSGLCAEISMSCNVNVYSNDNANYYFDSIRMTESNEIMIGLYDNVENLVSIVLLPSDENLKKLAK
jgi:hypothetical protein